MAFGGVGRTWRLELGAEGRPFRMRSRKEEIGVWGEGGGPEQRWRPSRVLVPERARPDDPGAGRQRPYGPQGWEIASEGA